MGKKNTRWKIQLFEVSWCITEKKAAFKRGYGPHCTNLLERWIDLRITMAVNIWTCEKSEWKTGFIWHALKKKECSTEQMETSENERTNKYCKPMSYPYSSTEYGQQTLLNLRRTRNIWHPFVFKHYLTKLIIRLSKSWSRLEENNRFLPSNLFNKALVRGLEVRWPWPTSLGTSSSRITKRLPRFWQPP